MRKRKTLFIFSLLASYYPNLLAQPPEMMLVDSYHKQDIQGWVLSEKLDGVRGYWDGKKLFSRQGAILNPPDYFIQNFPPFAIDGELFSQRNQFELISSITRSKQDKGWHKLKLYVFDVPKAQGDLFARLDVLKQYLEQHPNPYIEIIAQIPIQNPQHIQTKLEEVEKLGGEGLVIRDPKAPYEPKRSQHILKIKSSYDEECIVTAHHQGKGKFSNMLGSLSCQNHRGTFKIGTGFNFDDRLNPPPIGTVITYKYRGLTKTGKPKFTSYWRIREDTRQNAPAN